MRNVVWLSLFLCTLPIWGCAERVAFRHLDVAVKEERRQAFAQALEAYQAAADVAPGDAYVMRQLGRAYLRRQMYAEAETALLRAVELEPAYVAVYRDLALASEAQDKSDAALGWLERGAREVPQYAPLHQDLVDFHIYRDRPDRALELLEAAAERWPEAAWVHQRLGRLYAQLEWYDRAEVSLRKSLTIDPGSAPTYALLGNSLYEQEKYEEAVQAYRDAIARNPRDHSSLNNLAWVFAIQGTHLDEGLRLSRRSLRLAPDSVVYLDTMAELHFRRGDLSRAIEIIRRAISLQREDGNPYLFEHLRSQLQKFQAAGLGNA